MFKNIKKGSFVVLLLLCLTINVIALEVTSLNSCEGEVKIGINGINPESVSIVDCTKLSDRILTCVCDDTFVIDAYSTTNNTYDLKIEYTEVFNNITTNKMRTVYDLQLEGKYIDVRNLDSFVSIIFVIILILIITPIIVIMILKRFVKNE